MRGPVIEVAEVISVGEPYLSGPEHLEPDEDRFPNTTWVNSILAPLGYCVKRVVNLRKCPIPELPEPEPKSAEEVLDEINNAVTLLEDNGFTVLQVPPEPPPENTCGPTLQWFTANLASDLMYKIGPMHTFQLKVCESPESYCTVGGGGRHPINPILYSDGSVPVSVPDEVVPIDTSGDEFEEEEEETEGG